MSKQSFETYRDTIPSNLLSPKARALIEAEGVSEPVISADTSLRVKVIDDCGHGCIFCHNEGTQVNVRQRDYRVSVFLSNSTPGFLTRPLHPSTELDSEIKLFMKNLGISDIHLTGGEPTQLNGLPELVASFTEKGLTVKMTSNGETGNLPYKRLGEVKLNAVNISIFGSTPTEYAQTQPRDFGLSWAAHKLNQSKRAIEAARTNGIAVKANCVMSDGNHSERIVNLLKRAVDEDFDLRILNDLGNGERSIAAIYNLLAELEAVPTKRKLVAGASGVVSYFRLPNNQEVGFKQIRKARLNAACDGCNLDKKGRCEEGYYGIRLYQRDDDGRFMVGVCIQRMDLAMTSEKFWESPYPEQILQLRKSDTNYLQEHFAS